MRDTLGPLHISSGYRELSEWLEENGFRISKSALHRYGSAFEEKTENLRVATQMSNTLAEAVGDDVGAMNDALIRMAQGELFELLLKSGEQEDGAEKKNLTEILPEITLCVARLARASVLQKKWQTEFKDKLKAAADKVAKVGQKAGLSPEVSEEIRREILGVGG